MAEAETLPIEITDAMVEAAAAAINEEFGYLLIDGIYGDDSVTVAARKALDAGLGAMPRE